MKISAVLLAGGESRRLGRDKATLPWGNATLWAHQLQTLRYLSPVEILLSAKTEPNWRPPGARFVRDREPLRGPLSGLLSALSQMNGSHLLALAVDMPFMTADYLRRLTGSCAPAGGVCPFVAQEAEPLAAIYPAEALPVIERRHRDGTNLSLRSLVDELLEIGLLEKVKVDPAESDLFRNIDRAEDLSL